MKTITAKKLGKAAVIVDIVPKGNIEIRPAYSMNPVEITVHNTGNSGRGANADAHRRYLHNMADNKPKDTGYASYHFVVDDTQIIQLLPMNETAWHTGDGSGPNSGNRTAIGIEICENSDMKDYHQAEENAIALVVYLMKEFKISADHVKPHQSYSGKYCPRVILGRDGSFTPFRNRIRTAYEGETVVKAPTVKKTETKATAAEIKAVGTIRIVNVSAAAYICDAPSTDSKNLATIKLGGQLKISGSTPEWYEVIYEGRRAYIKSKYGKLV